MTIASDDRSKGATGAGAVDPLTLAVVQGALQEITNEMDAAFKNTAFSPIIAEGNDLASGIYHPETGEVISQGEESLPLFVAVMQDTAKYVLRSIAGRRSFEPGDVYIVNYPYFGGTHLMDVKMVMPYFANGELFALLANTGHWPDIGGSVPGGFAGHATEIYQEGLVLPPIRLYRAGVLDEETLQLILANIRVSRPRVGDMHAQYTSLRLGADRLDALVRRFGTAVLRSAIAEMFDRAEAVMRSHIQDFPDGVYHYRDHMDSDGVDPDPLDIDVTLTVAGSDMTMDFSRSSPACKGPLNSGLSSTLSACHVALKHVFPDVPINAGSFKPVHIIVPETCFLNAKPPRPVSGATAEVSQRIIDVTFGALAQAAPEKVTAGAFSSTINVTVGGHDEEMGEYVLYLYFGGGYGGHSGGDGISNGCSLQSTARMTPMEIYEQRHPFRVRHFRIRENSGGYGRQRGGYGVDMAIELLRGTAVVSLLGDRGKFPPRGLLGGEDGACTRFQVRHKNGVIYVPPAVTKDERYPIEAGDIIEICSGGGAGYGPASERAPEDRAADRLAGYYPGRVLE